MGFQKKHIVAVLFTSALAAVIALNPVAAFARLEKDRYSPAEKIGFAFYNLSGAQPDFKKWIEPKEKYRKAYPLEKQKIMKDELQRLRIGLLNYDSETDLIKLETEAKIEASNFFPYSQEEGRTTTVTISLKDLPKTKFFPFQIGEVWVAVVVKDMDLLTNVIFNADEYKEFATKLSLDQYTNTKSTEVNITFTLRPLSVDKSAPIELEGIEMWLMLAEVEHMEMWKDTGYDRQYLWEYKAPGYLSAEEQELRGLYWQQ